MSTPDVIVIAGSKSDSEIIKKVTDVLEEFSISYKEYIASAHRDPDLLDDILQENYQSKVFICIAGLSAALPGVVASKVEQPVIGVPVASALGGLDALLSIVQMPKGVPVATVGINNGANAAHLAARILGAKKNSRPPISYAEVGVDREREEKSVKRILELIRRTYQDSNQMPEGHFAGGITHGDDVLSMATDGVGSKVLLAQEYKNFRTVGIDCIAMNVNDLIATGSVPVAFVDYIAIEKQDESLVAELVEGLVEGCIESEIPLIGGETAVMSEVIKGLGNGFDIAGTALGIQKKSKLITGERIEEGDVILGIASSGIHSNGLTLARKIKLNESLRVQLLTPTTIYVKAIKELMQSEVEIRGMAHITGGGFTNILRLGKWHYQLDSWDVPQIFKELGVEVDRREMYRTFNMGIGFVLILPEKDKEKAMDILEKFHDVSVIGRVQEGNDVTISGMSLR